MGSVAPPRPHATPLHPNPAPETHARRTPYSLHDADTVLSTQAARQSTVFADATAAHETLHREFGVKEDEMLIF